MTAAVYLLAVAGFCMAFVSFGVLPALRQLSGTFRGAAAAMGDKHLDDREKERRIQSATLRAGRETLGLSARLAATLAAAAAPMVVADLTGLAPLGDTLAFAFRPAVLIGTVVALVALRKAANLRRGQLT